MMIKIKYILIPLFFGLQLNIQAQSDNEWSAKIHITNQKKINTEATDFAPAYWSDYIVFSTSKKRQRIFDPNTKEAFFDLFIAGINSENELERSAQLSKVLNSNYHEAACCFSDNDKHIYFSRMDEEGFMQIYESDFEDGEWTEPILSVFNEADSETLHPTISTDGLKIIFASNRNGGYGGMDLYASTLEGDTWSEPLNLGEQINTAGNDIFPFITQNGYLLFSSDGYKKSEDLDILKVKLNDISSQPILLPHPINSKHDDLSLICDYQGKSGYFSTNRPGGLGKDDIYHFVSKESIFGFGEADYNIMTIYTKEENNNQPISNVVIRYRYLSDDETVLFNQTLFDMDGAPYDSVWVDAEGRAQIKLNDGYTVIEAEASDMEKWQVAVTNKLKNKTLDILLKEKKENEIKQNQIVEDKIPKAVKLKEENLNVGTVLVFNNIYYDYNSHEIKKGAANELDELSAIMMENSNLKIQLSAHTDSRGEDEYNLLLSEKRAVSAKQYLIRKGVSSNRIFTIGYGEKNLRNHCKDGVICSESDHLFNRRTEVKILEN